MFSILLHTTASRPGNVVTLRTSLDWSRDVPGTYSGGAWRFEPLSFEYAPAFEFKFLLNRGRWKAGANIRINPSAGQTYAFTEGAEVIFEPEPVDDVAIPRLGPVEDGVFAQKYITANYDDILHDVVVVGSGVGGGIVAEQLSDMGRKVLLLESGSYLFPTHVGNLPRYYGTEDWSGEPKVIKNIWSLWDQFGRKDDIGHAESNYIGKQGYNLGGRSLFWGGYIPRMEGAEFDRWPQRVRSELELKWYDMAETLLRKSTLDTDYQRRVLQVVGHRLNSIEPDSYRVATLPMAIEHSDPQRGSVPAGVFSTSELLLESLLNPSRTAGVLAVNLNHHVLRVETHNRRARAVIAQDLISRSTRRYRGRAIVLCGGSIGSARVALASQLADPYGKVGRGITDHPIFWMHFRIPAGSPLYDAVSAAKVMFRHVLASETTHRYIGFVDLGSEFNQSRFSDPELKAAYEGWTENFMLGEVVFQLNSQLEESNWVGAPRGPRSPLRLARAAWTDAERGQMTALARTIIESIGGEPLVPGGTLNLDGGYTTGGVAHEAGSLRMGASGVVDENLRFHAYENLYACDLSVFPNSPAANPTLTLAALALRLAEHIDRSLD